MRKIGAFGAELRIGDLILSYNGVNSWSGGVTSEAATHA